MFAYPDLFSVNIKENLHWQKLIKNFVLKKKKENLIEKNWKETWSQKDIQVVNKYENVLNFIN